MPYVQEITKDDKVLLVKGIAGFGDRITTLYHCVRVARREGRVLIIDWRNYQWNHSETRQSDGGEGFFYYFDLNVHDVDILVGDARVAKVVEQLHCEKRREDIFPSAWFGFLNVDTPPSPLCPVAHWRGSCDALVRVVRCWGHARDVPGKFFQSLRVKPSLDLYSVAPRVPVGNLIAIHFRNSDRQTSLDDVLRRALKLQGNSAERYVYLATDDAASIAIFRSHFKERLVSNSRAMLHGEDGKRGTHQAGAHILKQHGVDKVSLNKAMLVDLCFMVASTEFVESRTSCLSIVAEKLRADVNSRKAWTSLIEGCAIGRAGEGDCGVGMSFEDRGADGVGRTPEVDGLVAAAGGKRGAVGRECGSVNRVGMPLEV